MTWDTHQPAVEMRNVSRQFGERQALCDVNFEINHGEVVALLGPNGSGKTTAVRVLTGVVRPTSGTSYLLGMDSAASGENVRQRVGVMTENSGLDDRLTAFENIATHGYIRRLDRKLVNTRTSELLERFGLLDRADDRVAGFSTGQRKRVALARALLHEPDVLLLDEPTSGLDPEATRDVLDLIASLASEHGRTVLFCTHFLHEAGRVCQRMVMLRYGQVLAFGAPAEIAHSLGYHDRVVITVDSTTDVGQHHQLISRIQQMPGVSELSTTPGSLRFVSRERRIVPATISELVAEGVDVYGVSSEPPSMEEVYFALSERHGGSNDAWR